jgi:hypothetical protein
VPYSFESNLPISVDSQITDSIGLWVIERCETVLSVFLVMAISPMKLLTASQLSVVFEKFPIADGFMQGGY